MREAYKLAELGAILGVHPSTLYRRAVQEGWEFRRHKGKGGGAEYLFAPLPRDVRTAVRAHEARPKINVEDIKAELDSRRISLSPSELSDPVVQAKVHCARAVEEVWGFGEKGAVVAALAGKYGKSADTIRRWVREVRTWNRPKNNKVVLKDQKVEVPRSNSFDNDALGYGLGWYANNLRNGRKAAYGKLVEYAQERGLKYGGYPAFTRLVKRIPEGVWTLIKKGRIGAEMELTPKIVRKWLEVPAQTVLCGDQHIFDYLVFDPVTGEVFNPNCYLWMDCTSRYWAGLWPELGHYNKYTVGYSLREACRFGIPDAIFTDWGKPEISKYTDQLVTGLSEWCHVSGWDDFQSQYGKVDHDKAKPGQPWSKPIENQFNIFERMFSDEFAPGYRKRDVNPWVNKERGRDLTKAMREGKLMSTEDLLELTVSIQEKHNLKAMNLRETPVPVVPEEKYFEDLAGQSRHTFDDTTLDFLFLPRFSRVPHQSMVTVTLKRGERRMFHSPALSGRRERVWVCVDPYDLKAPAVLVDQDRNFIDLAEPWSFQSMGDTETLKKKYARQAELMKWWKDQMKRVQAGFQAHGPIKLSPHSGTAQKAAQAADDRKILRPDPSKAAKLLEGHFKNVGGVNA